MMGRQARASIRVMRLWKPHDPGRSCLPFTIRHHVTNETDSHNDRALAADQLDRVALEFLAESSTSPLRRLSVLLSHEDILSSEVSCPRGEVQEAEVMWSHRV